MATFTVRYENDSLGIIVAINPTDAIQPWEANTTVTSASVPVLTDTVRRDFRIDLVTKLLRPSTNAEKVDYDEWKRCIAQARNDFDILMGGNFLELLSMVSGQSKAALVRKLSTIYRGEVRLT